MGHKTNPIGLRLGIYRKWNSNWFINSKNYPKFLHLNLNIEKFFQGFLYFYSIKTLLLNCQLIKLASNQIFIFIFYYRLQKKKKRKFYKWKIKWFYKHLKNFLKKNKYNSNKNIHFDNIDDWKIYIKIFKSKINLEEYLILKETPSKITITKQKELKELLNEKKNFLQDYFFIKFFRNFILIKNLKSILKTKMYRTLIQKIYIKKKIYKNLIKNFLIKFSFYTHNSLKIKINGIKNKFTKMKLIIKLNFIINKLKKQQILNQIFFKLNFLFKIKNFKNLNLKNILIKSIFNKNKLKIIKTIFNNINKYLYIYLFSNFFNSKKYFLNYKKLKYIKQINKKKIFFKDILNINFIKKIFIYKYFFFNKNFNTYKQFYLKKKYLKKQIKNNWKNKKKIFINKKKKKYILKIFKSKKNKNSFLNIKKFLSKITNLKCNIIFINTLSFTKFFYWIKLKKKREIEKFNIHKLQKWLYNKYKYNAIFIKDFISLSFIGALFKYTIPLVKFIGYQFKKLPKNRKQFKLVQFITKTLKICCYQRWEFIGFKFKIKGRLNRRTRTKKWEFKLGKIELQKYKTVVEYAAFDGCIRKGSIGFKLWFFYKQTFTKFLKKKLIYYFFYSKYQKYFKLFEKQQKKNYYLKKQNKVPFIKKFKKIYIKKLNFLQKKKKIKIFLYKNFKKNPLFSQIKTNFLKNNFFKKKKNILKKYDPYDALLETLRQGVEFVKKKKKLSYNTSDTFKKRNLQNISKVDDVTKETRRKKIAILKEKIASRIQKTSESTIKTSISNNKINSAEQIITKNVNKKSINKNSIPKNF